MKIIKVFILILLFVYGCKSNLLTEDNKINETSDTIYVGGNFTINGKENIENIAKWDGSKWSSLGTGISGKNASVNCMAFYNGELFIGGFIDSADGKPLKNIAKWNGTNWSDVGGGIKGKVNSMIVYKNMLYVAGWFSTAGEIQTANIARWDGNKWLKVGKSFSDEVYTLCVYNDELIAGGQFTKNHSDYVNANNVAKWDGVKWDSLGSGMQSNIVGGSWVMTLTVFKNELYASGNFTKCGNLKVSNIAKWDGNIWRSVGENYISNRIYSSAVYNNALHLTGESDSQDNNTAPYYAIWNGNTWNFTFFSFDDLPYVVYSKNKFLYIGGIFHSVNGNPFNGICKWDGDNFKKLGHGVNGYVSSIISP